MTKRKRQGNYSGGKIFGAPIWSPESKITLLCYPADGIDRVYVPPHKSRIRILAINSARDTRWEDGSFELSQDWCCPALERAPEWRQLGWVMADGSLPLGELQKVDPLMAQFNHLPRTDTTTVYHGPPFASMRSAPK